MTLGSHSARNLSAQTTVPSMLHTLKSRKREVLSRGRRAPIPQKPRSPKENLARKAARTVTAAPGRRATSDPVSHQGPFVDCHRVYENI